MSPGGPFILPLAAEYGVPILPADSEHSAIFQCMQVRQALDADQLLLQQPREQNNPCVHLLCFLAESLVSLLYSLNGSLADCARQSRDNSPTICRSSRPCAHASLHTFKLQLTILSHCLWNMFNVPVTPRHRVQGECLRPSSRVSPSPCPQTQTVLFTFFARVSLRMVSGASS